MTHAHALHLLRQDNPASQHLPLTRACEGSELGEAQQEQRLRGQRSVVEQQYQVQELSCAPAHEDILQATVGLIYPRLHRKNWHEA